MAILTQENAMSGYTAKQAEEDTLSLLKVWVWSGFYSEREAAERLEVHLSEEEAPLNLATAWDGARKTRIDIKDIDWKRRTPWVMP